MPHVTRSIRITRWPEPPERAGEALRALPGVTDVALERSRNRVRVSYEDSRVGYGNLVKTLEDVGCEPDRSWWPRLKAGLFDYLDGNARANVGDSGACCSNPKDIYSSRKRR